MREALLHALDLSLLGDWEAAKSSLDGFDDPLVNRMLALITRQQELLSERARAQAVARHEIGNALSIAQANIEGMADGILEPTPSRLNGIRDALKTAGMLLDELKKQQPSAAPAGPVEQIDVCAVIEAQIAMLCGIAGAKGVAIRYEPCGLQVEPCAESRGDAVRIGQILRNVLLNAVRYTPPGGCIDVHCYRPNGELTFSVSDTSPEIPEADAARVFGLPVVSKLLDALGGEARIVDGNSRGATFVIRLPVSAPPAG